MFHVIRMLFVEKVASDFEVALVNTAYEKGQIVLNESAHRLLCLDLI